MVFFETVVRAPARDRNGVVDVRFVREDNKTVLPVVIAWPSSYKDPEIVLSEVTVTCLERCSK